jgi:hypothetical protein
LCVTSSSDLSPESSVIDGLTVTGGTGKAVSTIHSGLQTDGSMPRTTRSSSGTRSNLSLTSLGVSLWPSSRKVVGLSRVILSWTALQCGHVVLEDASLADSAEMYELSNMSPVSSSIRFL